VNLREVRRLALSLPEASETPHFHLASFRVKGKVFATWRPTAAISTFSSTVSTAR
jgi:hypothetical protein